MKPCYMRMNHIAFLCSLQAASILKTNSKSMDRTHPKAPATWVLPISIAFAGVCIFGAGLVIHEPLEKIATRQSHTIVIKHQTAETLPSTPNRR